MASSILSILLFPIKILLFIISLALKPVWFVLGVGWAVITFPFRVVYSALEGVLGVVADFMGSWETIGYYIALSLLIGITTGICLALTSHVIFTIINIHPKPQLYFDDDIHDDKENEEGTNIPLMKSPITTYTNHIPNLSPKKLLTKLSKTLQLTSLNLPTTITTTATNRENRNFQFKNLPTSPPNSDEVFKNENARDDHDYSNDNESNLMTSVPKRSVSDFRQQREIRKRLLQGKPGMRFDTENDFRGGEKRTGSASLGFASGMDKSGVSRERGISAAFGASSSSSSLRSGVRTGDLKMGDDVILEESSGEEYGF